MAFKMIYDEESVTLVGKKSLTLKVPNPEYVTEHTWPKIKDMCEHDAFKFFHLSVARAIQFYEIEHAEKGPCRVVVREHPDPNHQVVLSYDNNEVKLEAGSHNPRIFAARFPHFVFEQLLVHMKDKKPRHALHIFLYEARSIADFYELPDDTIIMKYFEDYEYPEDTYDYERDEYPEEVEPETVAAALVADPFAGLKAAGFVQVRAEPEPVKKSFWSRIWSRFR
jgi:hypothetical protein